MAKGLVLLAIGLLGFAKSQDAKPCQFNEKCQCTKESDKVYTLVSCANLTKAFPKFENVDGGVKVQKFVVSGAIEEMPQTGLDKFSHIEHLVIEFTHGPASFRVEDKGKSTLANSSIDRMTLIGFRKLPPLTKSPRSIDEKTLASLSVLSIEKSDVDLDDDEAFKGATSLKALSLKNNGITDTTIADDGHPFKAVAKTLTELDLSDNAIQSYSYWKLALEDLADLQILLLNHNILQDLKGADMSKFPDLRILNLSHNLLLTSFDDSVVPSVHPALVELDLDHCGLVDFPTGAMKNMGSLSKLRLTNNKIEKLTAEGFSKNIHLKTLVLDGNPIQHVEAGTFKGLVALNNFTISNWDFDTLDLSIFGAGLENLQVTENGRLHTLKISDNESFPIFLRHMEISGNNISTIDESINLLLQKEAYFQMTISNEHNFGCPYEESLPIHVPSLSLVENITHNNESDLFANSTSGNETTTTLLPTTTFSMHPNATHSLMWLAKVVVCTHRIHLAENVFCAEGPDVNGTKVYDFLASMNPDCTGLTGTSTTPAPTPARPGPGGKGSAMSERVSNGLSLIIGLLIFIFLK